MYKGKSRADSDCPAATSGSNNQTIQLTFKIQVTIEDVLSDI